MCAPGYPLTSPGQPYLFPLARSQAPPLLTWLLWDQKRHLSPSSGAHLCSKLSLTPHDGERNHLEAKRRAALQGWVWDAEQWTIVGIIPIQDPRQIPKPTLPPELSLLLNTPHARPQEVEANTPFYREEVELQTGIFTRSRPPAGRDGLVHTHSTHSLLQLLCLS